MSGIVIPVSAIFVADRETVRRIKGNDVEGILANYNLPHTDRRKLENRSLVLRGYCRMQRVYLECIGVAKYIVVHQQVMQSSDFAYARHKY